METNTTFNLTKNSLIKKRLLIGLEAYFRDFATVNIDLTKVAYNDLKNVDAFKLSNYKTVGSRSITQFVNFLNDNNIKNSYQLDKNNMLVGLSMINIFRV